jgi:RNA polymerase primary sigma factor
MLAAAGPPIPQDAFGHDEAGDHRPRLELTCPRAPSEEAIVTRPDVEAALAHLPPRWQTSVRLRFGLEGGEPHTQREVAQALGCTPQRAGQIERKALARLEQLLRPRRRRSPPGGAGTRRV